MRGEAGPLVSLEHVVGEAAITGNLEIGPEQCGVDISVLRARRGHPVHRAIGDSLLLLRIAITDARLDLTESVHLPAVIGGKPCRMRMRTVKTRIELV